LHTVEVDDLRLDCEVCDDVSLIPLGRPWLVMIRDRRTGVILGFSIAVGAPSFESFVEALKHAWQPKDMSAYPGLEWRYHGRFLFLVVDRATHFVGASIELAAKHLGFDIIELAPASPQLKGGLEAANGYVNERVAHNVPGTVMGNVADRKLHEETRVLPMLKLSELRYLIAHFICTRANVMPKKGIGITRNSVGVPGAIWDREVGKIARRPMMNPLIFDRLTGDRKSLTVKRQGVTFDYITYWSPALTEITLHPEHREGAKYDCVRNGNNLDAIWVHADFLPAPLHVPACEADAGYAKGRSKQLHELLKGRAKVEENEARAKLLIFEHFNAAAEFSAEVDARRKLLNVEGIIERIKRGEEQRRLASTITRGTHSPAASAELLDMVSPPSVAETEALSPSASPIHRPPDAAREGKVRQYEIRDGIMAEIDRGALAATVDPESSKATETEIEAELERIAMMKRERGWSR
jgi:putative transposase